MNYIFCIKLKTESDSGDKTTIVIMNNNNDDKQL